MKKVSIFDQCLNNYIALCFMIFMFIVLGLQSRIEFGPYEGTEIIWYIILLCGIIYDARNISLSVLEKIDGYESDDLACFKYKYAKQAFTIRLSTAGILTFATWFTLMKFIEHSEDLFDYAPINNALIYTAIFICYFIIFKLLKIYTAKKDNTIYY